MKKVFLLFVLIYLVTGCAVNKTGKDWWRGLTKIELMQEHGLPVQAIGDGRGGELVLFSKLFDYPTTRYQAGYTIYQKILYFMDSTGKAYARNIDKSAVPPDRVDLTIYRAR